VQKKQIILSYQRTPNKLQVQLVINEVYGVFGFNIFQRETFFTLLFRFFTNNQEKEKMRPAHRKQKKKKGG